MTRWRDLLLLVAACAVLFGAGLGAHDLWNPNEPIYGEAVKEMAERGTWTVPHVNGMPFGEKPILYYWMALASSRLLGGVGETALRLPSVVAGTGLVAGVYLLVLPYAGRRRALASAIATLTTYQVWWVSRTIQMDVLVAATTVGVLLPVTRVWDHGYDAWKGWALAGLAAGLGFLGKGPVTWICPGLTLVGYAVVTRRPRELVRPAMLAGVAVAVAVAAPWYLTLWMSGRTDVLHEVLIRQNFQRFSNPWDHVAPFWYYVPYFFTDMAPWSFAAVLAWKLPRETEDERRLARLSAVWIVAIVGFFSLSKSKRDPYIVPVAPAAAILAADVGLAWIDGRLTAARARAMTILRWSFVVLFAAGAAALAIRVAPKYPELRSAAFVLAGVLAVSAVALGTSPRRRAPAVLAMAMAAFYLAAALVVLPAVDSVKSARPFCARLAAMLQPGDVVASYNFWAWRAEYRYYLGRPIENLAGEAPLREAWARPERVVLIVEGAQLEAARSVIGDRAPAYSRGIGAQTAYVFTNR